MISRSDSGVAGKNGLAKRPSTSDRASQSPRPPMFPVCGAVATVVAFNITAASCRPLPKPTEVVSAFAAGDDGELRGLVHIEAEQIGPRIVADGIKIQLGADNVVKVDLSGEDGLLVQHRPGQNFP